MSDTQNSAPIQVAAQIIAADPTQSVWVGANAGTGKTRVLINRILRLLLAGVPATRILCLTFTKAAAAEMANRLSEKLGSWAVMKDDKLSTDLQNLLGKPTEPATMQMARRLFAETLDAPGGLKIRTIHSFCESLLGRFPIEARIAPHFSVIDERTAIELRTEARNHLMMRAVHDEDNLHWAFDHLAGLVDEDGFSNLMRDLDSNRHRLHTMLTRHGGVSGIIDAIRGRLGISPDDTRESMICDAEGLDEVGLKRASNALEQGSATDKERAKTIQTWVTDEASRLGGFDEYLSVFLRKDGEAKAERSLMTKGAQKADPSALDVLFDEQSRLIALSERLKSLIIIEATRALLIIGDELSAAYRNIKAGRALLDYDDLILKAHDLLSDGRAGWVHYKLDGGIDHILVDEAQDTSPAQWNVISALAQDFFTGVGAGDDQRILARTVFAVGDQKQSIYSFQGADPAQFSEMQTFFAKRAKAVEKRWQEVELSLSFRSVWAVLNVVDQVFAPDEARDGLSQGDRPIVHQSSRDGQSGLVELWPTLTPEDGPDDDPWDAPVDQLSQKSPAVRLAEKIARTIAGWLEQGEILPSAGRPVSEGDIMILVRTRGQFAEEMVRQLKQRNIPVAGSDRMILLNQIAVMDLVAVGRFALLPDDDLNTAIVLKSPFVGFDDDDLFGLAYQRNGALWQNLLDKRKNNPKLDHAARILEGFLGVADFIPPYEFFSQLLNAGAGRKNLLGRLGPDAADAIDEFINLSLAYERDHAPSLEGFLDWLEAGETQIKRDMEHGVDQVRVMTVHGAKGLQSNIVFLPDTCSKPGAAADARLYWEKTDDDPLVFWPVVKGNEEQTCRDLSEQAKADMLREYRRLLYVGLTRAQDRVYVCGWETRNGRAEGCWYDLVETALKQNGAVEEVEFAPDEVGYRLGTPQTAGPDNLGSEEKSEHLNTPLPAWARNMPGAEPAPPDPLAPSRSEDEDPPVQSPLAGTDTNRFQRGLLIHRLLESLPALPEFTRRNAAKRFLALPAHNLEPAAQLEIIDETLTVLNDPALAPLFGPDSQAEVPLVGTIGSGAGARVLSAQIDRLLVTEDEVTIIDYKTNRPPPEHQTGVTPQYLRQMATYRAALSRIYPDKTVHTILLWTDGPRAMRLENALLEPYTP